MWLYEDVDLDDLQWDGRTAYGADYLSVDDATRFTFLDVRHGDDTADVVQLLLRVSL